MLNLPIQRHYLISPLLLLLIAAIFQLLDLGTLLQYNTNQVEQGQLWRMITGHFVHSNINHLLLNSAGIALIWALHGEYYRPSFYAQLLFGLSLCISLGLFLFYPQTAIYVGLSGVLHGMIIVGAIIDTQKGHRSGYLLFFGVWGKIVFEHLQGPNLELSDLIDARVAIESHLLGAFAGSCYWLVVLLKKQKRHN